MAEARFKTDGKRKKRKTVFLNIRDRKRINRVKIDDVLDSVFKTKAFRKVYVVW